MEKTQDGSLLIGALAANSFVAHHALVESRLPVLSQSILSGASPQLRNAASIGGNLLQKTRCFYYRDPSFACNKRQPGSGCPAISGANRMHAIFGTSDHCIAVQPSDMAVGLSALNASVVLKSSQGTREVALDEFYQLPGETPERETVLNPDELITHVRISADADNLHSIYVKVRDRTSYAFALVSVACAIKFENGVVTGVRLAAGGVAHKPWRLHEAESALLGRALDEKAIAGGAAASSTGAKGYRDNAVKIPLLERTTRLVLERLKEMA